MAGVNIRDALAKAQTATGLRLGHGWTASENDLEIGDASYLDHAGTQLHETLLEMSGRAGS